VDSSESCHDHKWCLPKCWVSLTLAHIVWSSIVPLINSHLSVFSFGNYHDGQSGKQYWPLLDHCTFISATTLTQPLLPNGDEPPQHSCSTHPPTWINFNFDQWLIAWWDIFPRLVGQTIGIWVHPSIHPSIHMTRHIDERALIRNQKYSFSLRLDPVKKSVYMHFRKDVAKKNALC
jgi:hypothetical protein